LAFQVFIIYLYFDGSKNTPVLRCFSLIWISRWLNSDGRKGGRPPFDPVLMFRILVIQTLNNLSDERTEYLINDRLFFMRFLGLEASDHVPDAKTIWLFRERLTQAGAIAQSVQSL